MEMVALASCAMTSIEPAELVATLERNWHIVPVLVERAEVVITLRLSMHAAVLVAGFGCGCGDRRFGGHCICDW